MNTSRRLEALEQALARLRLVAEGSAVLVEGRKDLVALEVLGIGGTHLLLNRGQGIQGRIDALVAQANAEGWNRIVLLLDWDRTGGRLFRALHDGLVGRVTVDGASRKALARAAHCKCIEHLPAELLALRRQSV